MYIHGFKCDHDCSQKRRDRSVRYKLMKSFLMRFVSKVNKTTSGSFPLEFSWNSFSSVTINVGFSVLG